MNYLLCIFLLGLISCTKDKDKQTPAADPRTEALKSLYFEKLEEAYQVRDKDNGWLSRNDCDGMIWSGPYAGSRGVADVNIEAAEYPKATGKFGRRPPPWCWTKEGGDQGSKTEWSRDMFIAGLLPYAWLKERRDILERHAAYGKANNWQMGEPVADGRTLYTPGLISVLFKAIHAMGGPKDANSIWPNFFPSGLVDYEAHLQVMSIWIQGEIAERLGDSDAIPQGPEGDVTKPEPGVSLRVSNEMYLRLQEHAARQPSCALYQATYGMYSGDMGPALDSLLGSNSCDYIRCSDDQCQLSEWIFAASLTLTHLGAL